LSVIFSNVHLTDQTVFSNLYKRASKIIKQEIIPTLIIIIVFLFQSCTAECVLNEPDLLKFNNNVTSKELQNKLKNDTLTVGMPYFVLKNIFGDCFDERGVGVSAIGIKKAIIESEGLGRVYQNPDIRIWLDVYKTSKGNLCVWYGNMNFYSWEIMKNDKILLYNNDNIDTAKILYLTKPRELHINKDLNYDTVQYSEIISREQNGKITSWYKLSVKDSIITINPVGMELYTIYRMTLNDKEIKSFYIRK
jgi:hypothetical protein